MSVAFDKKRMEMIEKLLYHHEGIASEYWRDRRELELRYVSRGSFDDPTWVSEEMDQYD